MLVGDSRMKGSIVAFTTICAVLAAGCGASDSSPAVLSASLKAQASTSSAGFATALQRVERLQHGSVAAVAGSEKMSPDEIAAASYCVKTGGKVYLRTPEYDTNSSHPLVLAGRAPFCQYTATTSGASRIHILLTTLYSTKPSLAALAYILKPPSGSCGGNPASCYCTL